MVEKTPFVPRSEEVLYSGADLMNKMKMFECIMLFSFTLVTTYSLSTSPQLS